MSMICTCQELKLPCPIHGNSPILFPKDRKDIVLSDLAKDELSLGKKIIIIYYYHGKRCEAELIKIK